MKPFATAFLALALIAAPLAGPVAQTATDEDATETGAQAAETTAETSTAEEAPAEETPVEEDATDSPAESATEAPAAEQPAAEQTAASAAQPEQPATPQEIVKETHGDWMIVCDPAGEPCVMVQTGKDPDGRNIMEVRVRKIEKQSNKQGTFDTAMQIAVPLGVLLPAGVNLKIDGNPDRRASYRLCDRGGCLVQEAIPAAIVNEMKRGAKAVMTIVAPPSREIPVEISLTGFTAAYNALQ